MGSVSGSPKNFESPYDKGQRFVGPDGASSPMPKKFAEGGEVKPPIQPGTPGTWTDLSQASGGGSLTKSEAKRSDTPTRRSGYPRKDGGRTHSDEAEDRKLFNKMFKEKGEK
jgi:hypothetical protein